MEELPVYGNDPRVRVKSLRGPWQEVEIRAHSYQEIDTPEFWKFLEQAAQSFQKLTAGTDLEDAMPWRKLGKRWHMMRKGFPAGKRIHWDAEILPAVCEMLEAIAPEGQYVWTNQVLVHFLPPGHKQPWVTMVTKKPDALHLYVQGPKNLVGFGSVTDLGCDRELDASRPDADALCIRFRTPEDLQRGDLRGFLEDHLRRCDAERLP
jgi:excinuclease ABC subunit A